MAASTSTSCIVGEFGLLIEKISFNLNNQKMQLI